MKDYSPFGGATPAAIVLGAILVACLRVPLAGDSSFGVAGFKCDWQAEPTVTRTYDVAKAIERIAAVEPKEKARADLSLYWVAVHIIKGSTGRYGELTNDRKWEKEHLTLDGGRLTVLAPLKAQAELARNIRAWEQAGLSQISVGARLIFGRDPESKMFLGMDNRMVVISDQQALDLTKATESNVSMIDSPRVTTFSGQQITFVYPSSGRSALEPANKGLDAKTSRETIPGDEIKLTWRAIENRDLTRIRLEGSLEVGAADAVTSAPSKPPTSGNPPTPGGHPDVNGHRRERQQLSFGADLPDGQAMLPVRIPTRDGKRCFYVLLTARRVIPLLVTETAGAPAAAK